MTEINAELRMVRLRLSTPRLVTLGKRRGLPLRDVDDSYLVHCLLGELFGEKAPKPFSIRGNAGRSTDVLAYTDQGKEALRHHADSFADPAVHAACDWTHLEEKQMPSAWASGTRLGFVVRVCPVVRASRDTSYYQKGSEVDAFLARFARHPEAKSLEGEASVMGREQVYREWLQGEMERRGGARLLTAGLSAFRLGRMVRRTHGTGRRTSVRLERPDATFGGEIEITDGALFTALLHRGIGRHRAFGFGMILLRPARL